MSRRVSWFMAPAGAKAPQVRMFVRGALLDSGIQPVGPEAERIIDGIEWVVKDGRLSFSVTAPGKVIDRLSVAFP